LKQGVMDGVLHSCQGGPGPTGVRIDRIDLVNAGQGAGI
jgi:hypothetical protein